MSAKTGNSESADTPATSDASSREGKFAAWKSPAPPRRPKILITVSVLLGVWILVMIYLAFRG